MLRVGLGYDIHRLGVDRALVLGGVPIPFPLGLIGHSDADVLLHALMDALLGAVALPDIGYHFPPADDSYQDASSLVLLEKVVSLLRGRRVTIVNVDLVLIAEEPKIGPYVDMMRDRIAQALGIESDRVGVKATTNEGLGTEGRGEAMSAHAVALVDTGEHGR